MATKQGLPYEEAAKQVAVTGWVCKTCRRFWGDDEHMARYCCAKDMPCRECGTRRTEKHYTCCSECRAAKEAARWAERYAKEAVDWDGETPLYSESADKFFFDDGSLADFIEDRAEEDGVTQAECARELRLILCEPENGRHFEMGEFLSDSLHEDFDYDDFEDIDKTVNDWIAAHAPFSWSPSGKPVRVESVVATP